MVDALEKEVNSCLKKEELILPEFMVGAQEMEVDS